MSDIMGTADAARYLGLSVAAVKYHLRLRHLRPGRIGRTLVFRPAELDRFTRDRAPRGRPRKTPTD